MSNKSLDDNKNSKKFEINWDVVGIVSAAVTLISGGVFFIAGWIYEVHWYGYYGLEVTQFELEPIRIMVQGIPGIFLLAVSVSISLTIFSVRRLGQYIKQLKQWGKDLAVPTDQAKNDNISLYVEDIVEISREDILFIIIWSYFIAFAIIVGGSIPLVHGGINKGTVRIELTAVK